jgi:hypothetical protein
MARSELVGYGALDDREWVLFSETLVGDCDLRARFSRFSGDVVRGASVADTDANAVRENADAFVRVLLHVWPTNEKRFPGEDGAFRGQLSSLLVRPEIGVRTIRPLVKKIIEEDGLSGEVAYALMTRPDPALRELVAKHVEDAGLGVTAANIFAIAILQRLGDNVSARLEALSKREGLSNTKRAVISVLLRKASANEQPSWDDIAGVEQD